VGNPSARGGVSHKASSESRFVALRGSSSKAAPANGHNLCTPWPSVQPAQGEGDSPSSEGGESSGKELPGAKESSPSRDEDSCAFSTPRIPKRDDPRVDPPSPFVPIDTRKVPPPQREMNPYSLPVRP
jgi:hypothetical protein